MFRLSSSSSLFAVLSSIFFVTHLPTLVHATGNKEKCLTIAEIACGTDGFETLCAAVVAAELDDALSDGSK